jgi:hypothetical protein
LKKYSDFNEIERHSFDVKWKASSNNTIPSTINDTTDDDVDKNKSTTTINIEHEQKTKSDDINDWLDDLII